MNYHSKYRQNKKLIWLYAEYLEQCKAVEERIKLSSEIGRLNIENDQIRKMPLEEIEKEYHTCKIEVNALL